MNQLHFIGYDNNSRPYPGQAAGAVSFGQEIFLVKTAGGATLSLGYSMTLSDDLQISVSGITGEIGMVAKQSRLALGVAVDPRCHVIHTGFKFQTGVLSTIKGYLQLPLSFSALEAVEHLRQGDPPEFTVVLHGSVFVRDKQTKLYDVCRLQVNGSSDNPVQFRADRDNWIQQMRNASPIGSVLVEIPLAVERPGPWNQVWEHLKNASANLAQGGEVGWKHCASEVRQAIEVWRNIDDSFLKAASSEGKLKAKEKDKEQRLHDVANALYHYCSLSVHTDEHKSSWTRTDAILALTAVCALLSVRNP
jgi:hypothetical protein